LNNEELKTPVVFIIFNRPDTTQRVFNTISLVKPKKLFVIADGPREDNTDDKEKYKKTREIIERVNWDCEVLKNYSETNLGCKKRVASGLDWVFQQTEEAIILEDDCLPDISFFYFCQELLEYYLHDKRIMVIAGTNFQFGKTRNAYSYYFSLFTHIWGWATWQRAWKFYDVDMKLWPDVKRNNLFKSDSENIRSSKYWERIFEDSYNGKINSWAYPWTFACWRKNGLTVIPEKNLVSNVGFGPGAVHTKDSKNRFSNIPSDRIEFPLIHPPKVLINIKADIFTQKKHFDLSTGERIKGKLRKIF